jgi:hypothetical protein
MESCATHGPPQLTAERHTCDATVNRHQHTKHSSMTVSSSCRRAPAALAVLLIVAMQALAPAEAQYLGSYTGGSIGTATGHLRTSRAGGILGSSHGRSRGSSRARSIGRRLLAADDVPIPGTAPILTPPPRDHGTKPPNRTCGK